MPIFNYSRYLTKQFQHYIIMLFADTTRDCPQSSKRHTEGRTNNSNQSKPAKASAGNSHNEPAWSGSSKPSSPSSSHPCDLRERLVHFKPTAVTPVVSGEDPVTLPAPQPVTLGRGGGGSAGGHVLAQYIAG